MFESIFITKFWDNNFEVEHGSLFPILTEVTTFLFLVSIILN